MRYAKTLVVVVCLLVGASLSAQADNTVCDNAILLVPDGSPHEGNFTAPAQLRWFRFVARANRSYVIMTENLSPTDIQPQLDMLSPFDACGGTQIGGTPTANQVPDSVSIGGAVGSFRRAVLVGSDMNLFFALGFGASGAFRVRIEETTLFNPLWSTFGGFETFYRFQNTTNTSCNVGLRLVNDAGMQVASTTLPIPANSTAPTVFTGPAGQGGLNVGNDQAGGAIITHDCPPGAIQVDGFTGRFDLAAPAVLPIRIQTARQMR